MSRVVLKKPNFRQPYVMLLRRCNTCLTGFTESMHCYRSKIISLLKVRTISDREALPLAEYHVQLYDSMHGLDLAPPCLSNVTFCTGTVYVLAASKIYNKLNKRSQAVFEDLGSCIYMWAIFHSTSTTWRSKIHCAGYEKLA